MTDHRRRAEKLVTELYFLSHEEADKDIERLASALKEVEEETWARAVGVVEKACPAAGVRCNCFNLPKSEYAKGDSTAPYLCGFCGGLLALTALRDEAAKK